MTRYLASIERSEDPALYVVTVRDDREQSGCVVGFATQCSIYPERLLVCISRVNHTFAVAKRASALAVHLLSGADDELARRFGEESGDSVDKFAGLDVTIGGSGAPILGGERPWVAGEIVGVHSFGDHVGFVIAPTESGGGRIDDPLRMNEISLDAGHPPSEVLEAPKR